MLQHTLHPAFMNAGCDIVEVFSVNTERSRLFASQFNCRVCDDLKNMHSESDLYLLAVPDGRIPFVADNLPEVNGIVAHTSGNTSIKILSQLGCFGVFYPLQTFTKGRIVDMSVVPFCIEASDEQTGHLLTELASKLSNSVHQINSRQRKFLHLAAVTVNNFSNHLYHLAEEFLENRELDFDLLKPLIMETAKKVQDTSPTIAQTGPARRGDRETIDKNIEMLDGNEEFKKLYRLLSEQILRKYHE